jgi:hypothetical protein
MILTNPEERIKLLSVNGTSRGNQIAQNSQNWSLPEVVLLKLDFFQISFHFVYLVHLSTEYCVITKSMSEKYQTH